MKTKLRLFGDENLDIRATIYILVLIGAFCGFLGFVYETIFYRIDLGYFVKRGSTFGFWIPIYAVGGILVTLFTYRLRKHPFIVFFTNSIVTGILEYATGYYLYEYKGIRLWDYNTEIWNFGNINGYICFRSILCFGLSSLFLIYIVIPKIIKMTKKMTKKRLAILAITIATILILDVVLYALTQTRA